MKWPTYYPRAKNDFFFFFNFFTSINMDFGKEVGLIFIFLKKKSRTQLLCHMFELINCELRKIKCIESM